MDKTMQEAQAAMAKLLEEKNALKAHLDVERQKSEDLLFRFEEESVNKDDIQVQMRIILTMPIIFNIIPLLHLYTTRSKVSIPIRFLFIQYYFYLYFIYWILYHIPPAWYRACITLYVLRLYMVVELYYDHISYDVIK